MFFVFMEVGARFVFVFFLSDWCQLVPFLLSSTTERNSFIIWIMSQALQRSNSIMCHPNKKCEKRQVMGKLSHYKAQKI